MRLYKYKSPDNLWYILDIVINQRLYCAHWSELNDPLEGRYSFFFVNSDNSPEQKMRKEIEKAREKTRISALSENYTNFLLWSHYANGHKGVAIEIDIPDNFDKLYKMMYSPFDMIFNETDVDSLGDISRIFTVKTLEWEYEKEYRIIYSDKYFKLPNPVRRIYIGPLVPVEQKNILREVLPNSVKLIETELNKYQGMVEEKSDS